MAEIKLEVGKTYETRDGRRHVRIVNDNGKYYPFFGISENYQSFFREDGRTRDKGLSPYDLVREVNQ